MASESGGAQTDVCVEALGRCIHGVAGHIDGEPNYPAGVVKYSRMVWEGQPKKVIVL